MLLWGHSSGPMLNILIFQKKQRVLSRIERLYFSFSRWQCIINPFQRALYADK